MTITKTEKNKPLGTREWYDFIGVLSSGLPSLHMGSKKATQELMDSCEIKVTHRVLDLGCGSGYTACLIAEKTAAQVFGIDLSPVMIEKADERIKKHGLTEHVKVRVADAFQLPFEDDFFDIAILESVLIPLAGDKQKALLELKRVLKSGAVIGVNESTIDPEAPPEMFELMAEHPATYGYFTPVSLRAFFTENGFEVKELISHRNIEAPNILEEMGAWGLVKFLIMVYPKILVKLLKDGRFRRASKIDDQLTKQNKQYLGYTIVVCVNALTS